MKFLSIKLNGNVVKTLFLCLILILYVVFNLKTLLVFPLVGNDECMQAAYDDFRYGKSKGKVIPFSYNYDYASKHPYAVGTDLPIIPYKLSHIRAITFSWLGISMWSIRLISFLLGSLALLFFYLLTRVLLNAKAALLASLMLIIHPKFVEFTHEGRQEAFLLAVIMISFYVFVLGYKKRNRWLVLGGVAFSLLGIPTHLNAIIFPFTLILSLFLLFNEGLWSKRELGTIITALSVSGLVFMFYLIGWRVVMHIINDPTFRPPIMRNNLAETFWGKLMFINTRFSFREKIFLLLVIPFMIYRRYFIDRFLLAVFIGFFSIFFLVIGHNKAHYFVYIYPFVLIVFINVAASIPFPLRSGNILRNRAGEKTSKFEGGALKELLKFNSMEAVFNLVMILVLVVFFFRYSRSEVNALYLKIDKYAASDYNLLNKRLLEIIPQGSFVMGYSLYWPALSDYSFQTSDMLFSYARGGKTSMPEFFEAIPVDYLILDGNFNYQIEKHKPRWDNLQKNLFSFLGINAILVSRLNIGDYHLSVYHLMRPFSADASHSRALPGNASYGASPRML